MDPRILNKCAACGEPATMCCAGCRDAPEYIRGDAQNTFYCDRACQHEGRNSHKKKCRNLARRIALYRAGHVLRTALLSYREMFFDLDLTKIESSDGILWLHQILKERVLRRGFPDNLKGNIEYKEAALLTNQCTLATALLSGLTRKLLSGMFAHPKPLFPSPLLAEWLVHGNTDRRD